MEPSSSSSSSVTQDLPDSVLQSILKRCDLQDIAYSACVSKRWCSVVSDDALWKELCTHHLNLPSAHDHRGNACPSFREAYKSWHMSFCKSYPLPLVNRAKACWEYLKLWAATNIPELSKSFRPGATEEEIDAFERTLGLTLPRPARLLYRFCDGQETPGEEEDEVNGNDAPLTHSVGLLGGYSFYAYTVNVYMLSLKTALVLTQHFMRYWGSLKTSGKWIIIAASIPLQKFFLLDCYDGSIHVGTQRLETHGETMSCVPPCTDMQDSFLRWLEEYSSRLKSGMYIAQKLDKTLMISLFPEREPVCTVAVTNGVQVRSSAVFVPEYSTLQDTSPEEGRFMFSYLIRMRLLPSGPGSQYHSFDSCQLLSRHWIIRENEMVKSEIRADAVIGLFPLLKSAGDVFTYASCSRSSSLKSSIEGDFTFVPGSMKCPQGAEFTVQVARFDLQVPLYVF